MDHIIKLRIWNKRKDRWEELAPTTIGGFKGNAVVLFYDKNDKGYEVEVITPSFLKSEKTN